MVVCLAGEFIFFVNFKILHILLGVTFLFGLLSSEIVEAVGNLLGFVMGQALGCAILIMSAVPDVPATLFEQVLRGTLDRGYFLYWFIGFPAGFIVRRFMPHSFSKTSEAFKAETEGEARAARAHFINHELGSSSRPLYLSLRETTEADVSTSPSIHLTNH